MSAPRRIIIGDDLRERCSALSVGVLECAVVNRARDPDLWAAIEREAGALAGRLSVEQINGHPEIRATREAYKRCGKDPNRYRPAAEALRRRAVQGKGLFSVNVAVNAVNLASLRSGCSINGWDADRVRGDVVWGIGRPGEPYTAIGRGPLNIEGLPVARDGDGPIGTPTSDEERVLITEATTRILVNVNSYAGVDLLDEVLADLRTLLERHAAASAVTVRRV